MSILKYQEIVDLIEASYNTKLEYSDLCKEHKRIIEHLKDFWIPLADKKPELGAHVFCITDLSHYGRGAFVSEFWYNRHGFVSHEDYPDSDDVYGCVTHWFYADQLKEI